MDRQYSYRWYIDQFKNAKKEAEKFVLSVDENHFLQPPTEGKWSIAECYSHLINYGNLYYDSLAPEMATTKITTDNVDQPFQPRWLFQKLINFFDPPYKMKLKTVKAMKPDPVSKYNRMELLDEYINLQDRFIAQLEKGQHRHVDLGTVKVNHPLIFLIKMTLTECFALAEVHQRRHQWQAKQTLKVLQQQL